MNSEILISFVIPVYNAEKSLALCLNSILNQAISCFEIIIINDGSTDNSQVVIDKYLNEYPNQIKAFRNKNGGPGYSRNFGIRKSSGSYIAFVDCDDFIEPNYVEVVKSLIDLHSPDMVIISYNRIYKRKQNLLEKFHTFNDWETFNKLIDANVMPEILCRLEVASWLRIVKRELFLNDDHLYFSLNSLGEDLEASLKWYLNADKIIVTNNKLYNYQINSNTLNFDTKNSTQFIHIIESVCNYYKSKGKFTNYFSELEYMFAKHILISNMLRLRAAKHKGKFSLFMKLRTVMLNNFPLYAKNKYFAGDPIYMRVAIFLSYYFPKFFQLIL